MFDLSADYGLASNMYVFLYLPVHGLQFLNDFNIILYIYQVIFIITVLCIFSFSFNMSRVAWRNTFYCLLDEYN